MQYLPKQQLEDKDARAAGRPRLAIAIALLLTSPSVCEAQEAPKKPLRERLLERAMKGDTEAQFDLAKGYEGGRMGLPQDLAQAAHWYLEAANRGDPFAQASLAIFYNTGKGVPRDYVVSYVWFARSAVHLTGPDQDTVIEMRDSVGRKLNTQQLAKARQMVRESESASKQ